MAHSSSSRQGRRRRRVLVLPANLASGGALPETRICAVCHLEVERKRCHRNRYREYICRDCQAKGFRFTLLGKLRKPRTAFRRWSRRLAWLVAALLAFGVFYSASRVGDDKPTLTLPREDRVDSAPDP